jgi:hypothetical protein
VASLSSISPTSGPWGTVVTISGSGFTGAQGVTFETIPAGAFGALVVGGAFIVVSDSTISCVVPQLAEDNKLPVSVVVTLANGGILSTTFIIEVANKVTNSPNGA